jgi:hypothetical protein
MKKGRTFMGVGLRTAALGDRLRTVARDLSGDLNERYFLAHAALLRLLQEDPELTRSARTSNDLRAALRAVA